MIRMSIVFISLVFAVGCTQEEVKELKRSKGPGVVAPVISCANEYCHFIELLNNERLNAGDFDIPFLAGYFSSCHEMAIEQAKYMASTGDTNSDREGERFRNRLARFSLLGTWVTELNVRADSFEEALKTWMSESGPKAMIMNSNFVSIGVGVEGGYWSLCLTEYAPDLELEEYCENSASCE